jgi:arginase
VAAPRLDPNTMHSWLLQDVAVVHAPLNIGQPHSGTELTADLLERYGTWDRLRGALTEGHKVARDLTWQTNPQKILPSKRRPLRDQLAQSLQWLLQQSPPSWRLRGQPFFHAYELARRLQELCEQIRTAAQTESIVVTLGGDHSVAVASINALSQQPGRMGVLWVDAHGDFNTPVTSPSKNFHGMPLAALCRLFDLSQVPGFGWFQPNLSPRDIVHIGSRAFDTGEREAMEAMGIQIHSAEDVRQKGAEIVMAQALDHLEAQGIDRLHISFDVDALDDTVAPGTGTPEPGGLTIHDAQTLCASARQWGRLASLDVVEANLLFEDPDLAHGSEATLVVSPTLLAIEAILMAALTDGEA